MSGSLKIGFGRVDITPRIGVELCGFGPYLLRRSIGVRDRLWARAMAVQRGNQRLVLVSADLIGISASMTAMVRERVARETGLSPDGILTHATHTHSGPGVGLYTGWGEPDGPTLELLPSRLAEACIQAVENLQDATLSHAEIPCEGIGLNREYDRDAPPLAECLADDWRPAKPELTDTTCHVFAAKSPAGRLLGFVSYFGCHPVCCCSETRYIHGDYCGVATNLLERENPGATGLFLQGAQGDVNSCVVHKPETESLLALDVIAGRYACSVRHGLSVAKPVAIEEIAFRRRLVSFHCKNPGRDKLEAVRVETEALLRASGASDSDPSVRMATVRLLGIRTILKAMDQGKPVDRELEIQGFRLGPVAILASPFEIFQAIKNEVKAGASAPIPLVVGISNGSGGYAVDRTAAARGGYAADWVPVMQGNLPYVDIHGELVRALLQVEDELWKG